MTVSMNSLLTVSTAVEIKGKALYKGTFKGRTAPTSSCSDEHELEVDTALDEGGVG